MDICNIYNAAVDCHDSTIITDHSNTRTLHYPSTRHILQRLQQACRNEKCLSCEAEDGDGNTEIRADIVKDRDTGTDVVKDRDTGTDVVKE